MTRPLNRKPGRRRSLSQRRAGQAARDLGAQRRLRRPVLRRRHGNRSWARSSGDRRRDVRTQLRAGFLVAPAGSRQEPPGLGLRNRGLAIWDWDFRASKIHVSDLILTMTGYRREDIVEDKEAALALFHPEDLLRLRQAFSDFLCEGREQLVIEFRLRVRGQHYRWFRTRTVAAWDQAGRPVRMVGSLSDVSDLKAAEEERDRLFNLSVDLLGISGFDGYLQQINPAWVRVLGWSRNELMDRPMQDFIHAEDQPASRAALAELESGEPVRDLETRFRCRDGSFRWLSWNAFPLPDRQLIFSVGRDVTERHEAEKRLLHYQGRLRSLSNQLSLVEDRQRRQLAAALHDWLAQNLFALRTKATLLKYPDQIEDLAPVIQEIIDVLDQTLQDTRNLTFELFPPVLYEVGLEAALAWLTDQFERRSGIRCRLVASENERQLAEDVRGMVYQCVRELLNNVEKHARASWSEVSVTYTDGMLRILIDDDGRGFDLAGETLKLSQPEVQGGFGLFSIRERLHSIDGEMIVDTRPGEGCRVTLDLPICKTATEAKPTKPDTGKK